MKRRAIPLSLAVAAAAVLAPAGVQATDIFNSGNVCTTGSLVLCDVFTVTFDAGTGQYTLTVVNDVTPPSNVSDPGFITGLALFNLGSTNYGFDIVSASPSWTLIDSNTNVGSSACNDVGYSGAPAADIQMGDCTNGATTAQTVSIVFTTTTALSTSDFSSGTILIGGDHVQGVFTCSVKFYSNGTVLSTTGSSDIDACGTTTVPEPVSMVLLGSGLLGLALPAARLRRRKKEEEEA